MNKPKKSLGQNFLKSEKIAREIVEAGGVGPEDIVLEVGPGRGILTEILLQKAKRVIAVEKDEELVCLLKEKFADDVKSGKLEIVSGDILDQKISNFQFPISKKLSNDSIFKYKIIANIPYYITSRFLRTFLESDFQPSLMVLMVQKEVAERIARVKGEAKQNFSRFTLPRSAAGSDASQNFASPRPLATKESLLSISVKAYGQPEIIRKVPAGYFFPAPKVDSAVLKISNISKDFFRGIASPTSHVGEAERKFFETVKKGFSQKRKMLINNLKADKKAFTACNIGEKARAEELSLEQWKCLTGNVKVSP